MYFKKLVSDDKSVVHSGDELTGQKEGIDEKITIYLDKISPLTKLISILVNSYSGQDFQRIETAELSIYKNKVFLTSMSCAYHGDFHSLLAGFIYQDKANIWTLRNINQTGHQKNFVECLAMITSAMRFLIDDGTLKEIELWNVQFGKSFDLKKGNEIPLPNCLEKVAIGLGWETNCDIDSSVITIDKNGNEIEYIFYGNLDSINRSIHHCGDNLTGIGPGDDENIIINLPMVDHMVEYIACSVNVYTSSKTFNDVTEAFCRLIEWESKREFCKYNLNEWGNSKCCILCYLKRGNGGWKIKALGKFLDTFNRGDVINAIKFDAGIIRENEYPKIYNEERKTSNYQEYRHVEIENGEIIPPDSRCSCNLI